MTRNKLVLLAAAITLGAHAETFNVDPTHAEIGFTARHLMLSNVKGTFNRFEGSVVFDLAEGKLVSMSGSIDATSIDTNNKQRDEHLKSNEFFDVGTYSKLSFKSTAAKKTGEDSYEVTGNLTVLGVERKVVLPVKVAGPIDDPWGNKRIGLSCSTELNRRDLGITSSPATMIGDTIKVDISAEAVLKTES